MTKIKHFKNLIAWQVANEIVLNVYQLSKTFPSDERYGLTSQMRRASISVVSNIAEGFGFPSYKHKIKFYNSSRGSLYELECQMLVCKELTLINMEEYHQINKLILKEHKLLNGLIKKSQSFIS